MNFAGSCDASIGKLLSGQNASKVTEIITRRAIYFQRQLMRVWLTAVASIQPIGGVR
jgi:hypothetical protein